MDANDRPEAPTDRALDLTPTPNGSATDRDGARPAGHDVPDPLRLCIFATVALITWLAGPWGVAMFSALGIVGYIRARRAGLLRSRCVLGDTRLVLAYLGLLFLGAMWAAVHQLTG